MTRLPAAPAWPAFGVGAALAVWLTAPALGFFDAGELAAAAVEPGVPHPTGFPLLLLVGQLARLLPVGTLAGRVHAIGALATVAAAVLLVDVLRRELRRALPPSIASGVVFAAAIGLPAIGSVALHARQTEVYPLALLHAVLLLTTALRGRGAHRLLATVALLGIGVGVHTEAVGLATAALAYSLWRGDARSLGARGLPSAALALVTGAAVVLALPLVAQRRPALDWGGVDALEPLWAHLSGASIRAAFADRIGAAPWEAAGALARMVGRDLGQARWVLPFALLGLWALRPRARAVLGGLLLADALWAVVVNPMGIRDQQVGLLLELGLAALIALGLATAAARLRQLPSPVAAAGLVGLSAMAVVGSVLARPPATLAAAARYGDALVDALPVGGLGVVSSDHAASACLWLQAAEGARPDARCVPVVFGRAPRILGRLGERLTEPSFVAAASAVRGAEDARDRAAALGRWLRPYAAADALAWEPGRAFEDAQIGGALRPGLPWGAVGLAAAASMTAADGARLASWASRFCAQDAPGCAEGSPLRHHLADSLAVWGGLLLRRGDAGAKDAAEVALRAAVALGPDRPRALHNLAVQRLGAGAVDEAAALAAAALAADPTYRPACRSAARAALRAGDGDRTLAMARCALGPRPGRSERRWLQTLVGDAAEPLASELRALAPVAAR